MNDKTFHPNWAALTLMFFALVFSAYLCSQLSTASATPWMVYSARFCVAGLPLILLIWLMSVRLTIAQEGIAYRSIFGSKSLTWREIQYIKTSSTRYLLNGMFPFAERTSF